MKPRYLLVCAALVVTALALAFVYYPSLPARIPIHWNMDGVANGYGPRAVVFAVPALMAALTVFGVALPWLSPRTFTVDSFRDTYCFIIVAVVGMVGYLHAVTIWSIHAGGIDPARAALGGVAVFMLLVGNLMGKVRRNFWIGIRTPWTLANEKVWYATHRLAGKLMVACSLLCGLGLTAGLPMRACLAVLLAGALIPAAYSLMYYKRLERSGNLEH
jgi:uncharacterized membrane protein